MLSTQEILKQYWGYDNFRPLQEEIIESVLSGNDTLALLPTGGGKSICFQVPALAKEGLCLVISPLIALMKDQVEALKQKGILALSVHSGMGFLDVKKTLQNAAYGNFKFLYVSPERLETNLFLEFLQAMKINLIAVDEAHCVSQWGYDFRPPYLRIANIRAQLPGVPILALTASATKLVQDDICEKLMPPVLENQVMEKMAFLNKKENPWKIYQLSFERKNLSYSVFNPDSKQNKLLEILKNVGGTAIVYCKSRKRTKEITEFLRMHQINADFYHAGLSSEERNNKQDSWIKNKTRVIVSTNAFGMGIDKADVRIVVHYDVPDCIENYYQEAGRAGRDRKRAYAVLLYGNKELEDLQSQSKTRYPDKAELKNIYTALMNFLQVAAGSGEGMQYDLDLAKFSSAFKLNILTATYAIKVFEQEELVSFTEMFFKPPTVTFCVAKESLFDFENTHPQLEPTIKGLLRSYPGVFDFPSIIHETNLARFLKKDTGALKLELKQLHENGIIIYEPQKETPQILLLKNRMYQDSYLLDTVNYLKRKKYFEQRIVAIVKYTNNSLVCRAKIISAYFNAPTQKDCGICDNCINQKFLEISAEEFENIRLQIFKTLEDKNISLKEIFQKLNTIKKEKLWKVLIFLQTENKIKLEENLLSKL